MQRQGAHPRRGHLPGGAVATLRPRPRCRSLRRLPGAAAREPEPVPLLPAHRRTARWWGPPPSRWCGCATAWWCRGPSPGPAAGARTDAEDDRLAGELVRAPQGGRRARHAGGPGPQRRGAGGAASGPSTSTSSRRWSATATSCISPRRCRGAWPRAKGPSTSCGPPSRPGRCRGPRRCGPCRSSTTSSPPSAASTAGWWDTSTSRATSTRPSPSAPWWSRPTGEPRCRPGPGSWPTAIPAKRTWSVTTRRPPCSPRCPRARRATRADQRPARPSRRDRGRRPAIGAAVADHRGRSSRTTTLLRTGVGCRAIGRDVLGCRAPTPWSTSRASVPGRRRLGGGGVGRLPAPHAPGQARRPGARGARPATTPSSSTSTAGSATPVAARLARFKLRVKVDIEPLPWRCVALRGPGAPPRRDGHQPGDRRWRRRSRGTACRVSTCWVRPRRSPTACGCARSRRGSRCGSRRASPSWVPSSTSAPSPPRPTCSSRA